MLMPIYSGGGYVKDNYHQVWYLVLKECHYTFKHNCTDNSIQMF